MTYGEAAGILCGGRSLPFETVPLRKFRIPGCIVALHGPHGSDLCWWQMQPCRKCTRLLRHYKYALKQRYRLDEKLASALRDLDRAQFEDFSTDFNDVQTALMSLSFRILLHEFEMGHRPLGESLSRMESR
jgi:hypothetical protein